MGNIMAAYVTDVNYDKKAVIYFIFFMLLVLKAELSCRGDSPSSKLKTAGAESIYRHYKLIQKALPCKLQ